MSPQEFVDLIMVNTLKPRPKSAPHWKNVVSVRLLEFSERRIVLEFDLAIENGKISEYSCYGYDGIKSFALYKAIDLLEDLYEKDPFSVITLPTDPGDWSVEWYEYARYRVAIGLVSSIGSEHLAYQFY